MLCFNILQPNYWTSHIYGNIHEHKLCRRSWVMNKWLFSESLIEINEWSNVVQTGWTLPKTAPSLCPFHLFFPTSEDFWAPDFVLSGLNQWWGPPTVCSGASSSSIAAPLRSPVILGSLLPQFASLLLNLSIRLTGRTTRITILLCVSRSEREGGIRSVRRTGPNWCD